MCNNSNILHSVSYSDELTLHLNDYTIIEVNCTKDLSNTFKGQKLTDLYKSFNLKLIQRTPTETKIQATFDKSSLQSLSQMINYLLTEY